MKMTGAEWREFEATGWPEGYIWSDDSCLDNGIDIDDNPPADAEVFIVPAGWRMGWEGGDFGQIHPKDKGGEGMNVRAMIRAWRQARDSETIAVTVPKTEADTFRALMAERGWKFAT